MSITLNITINVKVLIAIIFIIIITLILIYKKNEHLFVGTEPVINIAKVYADATGTASFNNINLAGNASINGNFDVCGNISTKQKLLFQTNATANKWEGIHTFWMQTGWAPTQDKFIINPDNEKYNADNWVCVTLYSFNFTDESGVNTYVDNATNDWCIRKQKDIGARAAYVFVMCYPRQMFTKAWAYKGPHTETDVFSASLTPWNTRL
jgi:hypothetical protein